jgi:hypothetical protein
MQDYVLRSGAPPTTVPKERKRAVAEQAAVNAARFAAADGMAFARSLALMQQHGVVSAEQVADLVDGYMSCANLSDDARSVSKRPCHN